MKELLSPTVFADSKPHYELLDGLRGVAALLVVWYHVFEGYAFAGNTQIEHLNHGYLAVDFFFILSGFVIGYAYDNRWGKTLTLKNFFKRRLIRLHPMVILGAILGAITFCIQGNVQWDGTHISTSAVMLSLLCAMFFIPAVPGCRYEVRGNGEMFPLNGPSWSLFFEYIGNIAYALCLRRLSTKALATCTVLLGLAWGYFSMADISGTGSMGVGWTIDQANFIGGLIRMFFPFSMGLLLSRVFTPWHLKGAFWICSIVLLALFLVPYIEGNGIICLNGVFEFICVAFIFPFLVWIGASGATTDRYSTRICNFLGNLSFPLYITHYPFMYLFYAWLIKNSLFTLTDTWAVVACVYIWNVLVAYACLKLYDEPVRKWLSKKWLNR